MDKTQCPVCGYPPERFEEIHDDVYRWDCPRCGSFRVSFEAATDFQAQREKWSDRQIATGSGWLRTHPDFMLQTEDIDRLTSMAPPPLTQRMQLVLESAADKTAFPGNPAVYDFPELLGVAWATNRPEIHFLLNALQDAGRITWRQVAEAGYEVTVNPEGYFALEQSGARRTSSIQAFVAMPFAEDYRELYEKAIIPAVEKAGYKPYRVDYDEHVERIDDKILSEIKRSRFLIADVTDGRQGVYFEAGYALGLGLHVVWSCRHSDADIEGIHFDTRQFNTLFWKTDGLPAYQERLRYRIEFLFGRGSYLSE